MAEFPYRTTRKQILRRKIKNILIILKTVIWYTKGIFISCAQAKSLDRLHVFISIRNNSDYMMAHSWSHWICPSRMKLGTTYKKFQNFYFLVKQGLKWSTRQHKITHGKLVMFWNLISCQAAVFGTEFLLKPSNFILRKLKLLYKIWQARKWPQFSSIKIKLEGNKKYVF